MALLGLDLPVWFAVSWQLVEEFLCIPKRMGFSLCLFPKVLAEVCWGRSMLIEHVNEWEC